MWQKPELALAHMISAGASGMSTAVPQNSMAVVDGVYLAQVCLKPVDPLTSDSLEEIGAKIAKFSAGKIQPLTALLSRITATGSPYPWAFW